MRKSQSSTVAVLARVSTLGLTALLLSQCSSEGREFDDAAAGNAGMAGGSTAGASTTGTAGTTGGAQSTAGAGPGGASSTAGSVGAGDGGDQASGGDGSDTSPGTAGGEGGSGTAGTGATGGINAAGTGGSSECTSGCLTNGSACTAPTQCKSARCVDGVCCDKPCDGTCEACSETLTGAANGVCSSAKKGTDPHDDCAAEEASTCGQTGMCGSGGVCALYDSNTVCKIASCASGSEKSAQKCDGAGVCKAGTTTACNPYVCGSNACLETCSKNADCVSGKVCVNSACQDPSDLLGACDEAADCAKGECISKMCGLSIKSIRITGVEVPGGGGQILMDGWYKTDSNGRNSSRATPSITPSAGHLWLPMDVSLQLTTPLPPGNYLMLTGSEGSNALTRTFQFNLSDGSSISRTVQASSSDEILCNAGAGDTYKLFQWTGATVNVLSKTY